MSLPLCWARATVSATWKRLVALCMIWCAHLPALLDCKAKLHPATTTLAAVIRGWDEPIQLMRVGERATLVVRPGFAYAARTDVSLPPNSTLIFDVTVLSAEPVD